MAQATPEGTGVEISGDYFDLEFLKETIENFSDCFIDIDPRKLLVTDFVIEIEQTIMEERNLSKLRDSSYYSFNYSWVYVLPIIATLRSYAAKSATSLKIQSMIYLLESLLNEALEVYDPKGAIQLKSVMDYQFHEIHPHYYNMLQTIHVDHIKEKNGKKRFRNLVNKFHTFDSDYILDTMAKQFEDLANSSNEKNIYDLGIDDKSIPFDW